MVSLFIRVLLVAALSSHRFEDRAGEFLNVALPRSWFYFQDASSGQPPVIHSGPHACIKEAAQQIVAATKQNPTLSGLSTSGGGVDVGILFNTTYWLICRTYVVDDDKQPDKIETEQFAVYNSVAGRARPCCLDFRDGR